jgi:hypothetical protein
MASRIRVPALIVIALFLGTAGARAQSPGPEEAVKPDGGVTQQLALTAAQQRAIYNAVANERVHPSRTAIPAAVGAPVSHSVQLFDLPDQALADNSPVSFLKYAMVEDDVVVVDPVQMRVVDVIHGGARP